MLVVIDLCTPFLFRVCVSISKTAKSVSVVGGLLVSAPTPVSALCVLVAQMAGSGFIWRNASSNGCLFGTVPRCPGLCMLGCFTSFVVGVGEGACVFGFTLPETCPVGVAVERSDGLVFPVYAGCAVSNPEVRRISLRASGRIVGLGFAVHAG